MNNLKIISGGQTGVDRGALDAALALNISCGGWCPQGRLAEDGVIGYQYPLQETESFEYKVRTLKNILDSDASVIIYFQYLMGGTEQTLVYAIEHKKPYLLLCAQRIYTFIQDYKINILNIAYSFSKQIINTLFTYEF